MSMRVWTVSGFGVLESDLEKIKNETWLKFIEKFLPKDYDYMMDDLGENYNDEDLKNALQDFEDEDFNKGIGAIFAEAINNNEKDFYVECLQGVYFYENAILYEDRQPWHMSDRVKGMTAKDMGEVFKKYLKELGLENIEPDEYSVEFYG